MASFTIDELTIPVTIDGPGGADFISAIEVGNAVAEIGYGTPDLGWDPREELAQFVNPHNPRRMLVARVDGEIVARGTYATQVGDGADSAQLLVEVLPALRGRGIGTALSHELEAIAAREGKAKVIVFTPVPDAPGDRLVSPTGFGSIAANDPSVQFLLARGYRLEQVERASRLSLPVAGIDDLVAAAQERSGADYAVRCWIAPTPARWRADLATLNTRMSTDAPSAGLEEPEDVWTVERVIEADERYARMDPRTHLTAAIEHLPSGALVGYTQLSVTQEMSRAVYQWATLVLREHRGHKLGMLLKVANLAHLERVAPGHPSIITFNAEENRHMLDVNEAVGFVRIASESAWRKDL